MNSSEKQFSMLSYHTFQCDHREHTNLLNRKRLNKGMKRMNSLPSSPVVISYATLQEILLITSPA